jgi:hypothetical protein
MKTTLMPTTLKALRAADRAVLAAEKALRETEFDARGLKRRVASARLFDALADQLRARNAWEDAGAPI